MIVYCKFGTQRLPQFRLNTIFEEVDGRLKVAKVAESEQAAPFLRNILASYKKLKKSGLPFDILEPRAKGDLRIEFEHLELESLEFKLRTTVINRDRTGFFALLQDFCQKIRSMPADNVSPGKEFKHIFGDSLPEAKPSCKCGCLDFNFDNIFIKGNSQILIDFEWCFNFPIPLDYIIFRAISGFYGNNISYRPNTFVPYREVLHFVGIDENSCFEFMKMEEEFQRYVYGDKWRPRTKLSDMTTYDHLSHDKTHDFMRDLESLRSYVKLLEKESSAKNDWISKLEQDIQQQNQWIIKIEKDNADLHASLVEQSAAMEKLTQSKGSGKAGSGSAPDGKQGSYDVMRGLQKQLQEKGLEIQGLKDSLQKMSADLRLLRKMKLDLDSSV